MADMRSRCSWTLSLLALGLGAATAVRATAATTGTTVTLGSSSLALSRWRWADKSVVNVDGLVEELGVVQVLDGLGGLGESGVFDQGISLK